jgi:uncharacterized membrane protein YqaE (UPF0057 family)
MAHEFIRLLEDFATALGFRNLSEAMDLLRVVLSILLAFVGVAIAWARLLQQSREARERKRLEVLRYETFPDGAEFERRLDAAVAGLKDALTVIGGLEQHIKQRAETATRLKTEIDHYRGVQALQKEQLDAVATVLQDQLKVMQKEDQRAGFKQDVLMNTIFMILGAVLSYFIAKWLGV